MFDIVKCIGAFAILIILFYILGCILTELINIGKRSFLEKILIGFFTYFSVYQCLVLPMILMQKSFSLMCKIWIVILLCIIVIGIFYLHKRKKLYSVFKINPIALSKKELIKCTVSLVFLLIALGLIVIQPYAGWDTGYYVGTMNEAIYSDRMYTHISNDGTMATVLDMQYVFNGAYFMQFALISALISVKPMVVAYFLMRGLGYFLSVSIVYLLGKEWFEDNVIDSIMISVIYVIMNFCWNTYLSTDFFVLRLYEGKGYCQNVVILFAFLCLVKIYRNEGDSNTWWKLLFLVSLTSVPLSMSSVLTLPAMLGIGVFALWVTDYKNISLIFKGCICVLPNVFYFIAYYLGNHGFYKITIS